MKLLLISAEQSQNSALTLTLNANGYRVIVASDSKTGLKLVNTDYYNVVVFDASASSLEALSFCQTLRSQACQVPILLLASDDSSELRIASLNAGADDFLAPPFGQTELLLRIQALQRRGQFNLLLNPEPQTWLATQGDDCKQLDTVLSGFWERFKPSFLMHVDTLEQAVKAASTQTLSSDLQENAIQDAHRLAGSLGIFGYSTGSSVAHEIEELLRRNTPVNLEVAKTLDHLLRSLKHLLQQPPNFAELESAIAPPSSSDNAQM